MYMLLSTFTTSNLLTLSNQEYNHCSLILLYTATEEKLLSDAIHDTRIKLLATSFLY